MPAQPVEIEKTAIFFSGKMKRYINFLSIFKKKNLKYVTI